MPCGGTYDCPVGPHTATATFLALGGRHTDSAISYTDAEPGIGLAMREWMAASPGTNKREDLFITSKVGPGGACWPLGFNESIAQAKLILGYYNELPLGPSPPLPTTADAATTAGATPARTPLPRSASANVNITQLDMLIIHWPLNCGPCSLLCPGELRRGRSPCARVRCSPPYWYAGAPLLVSGNGRSPCQC